MSEQAFMFSDFTTTTQPQQHSRNHSRSNSNNSADFNTSAMQADLHYPLSPLSLSPISATDTLTGPPSLASSPSTSSRSSSKSTSSLSRPDSPPPLFQASPSLTAQMTASAHRHADHLQAQLMAGTEGLSADLDEQTHNVLKVRVLDLVDEMCKLTHAQTRYGAELQQWHQAKKEKAEMTNLRRQNQVLTAEIARIKAGSAQVAQDHSPLARQLGMLGSRLTNLKNHLKNTTTTTTTTDKSKSRPSSSSAADPIADQIAQTIMQPQQPSLEQENADLRQRLAEVEAMLGVCIPMIESTHQSLSQWSGGATRQQDQIQVPKTTLLAGMSAHNLQGLFPQNQQPQLARPTRVSR